jgi:hypothetical protein
MATPARNDQASAEPTAKMAEVLQAATRVLAGVALRSVDVLGGAVSLPQLRVLAVLDDLGRPGLPSWHARSARTPRP